MKYTLIADGRSDTVLIPIIDWSFRQFNVTSVGQCADLGRIPRQPSSDDQLKAVIDLYDCDVLFVHRDAEGQPADLRREQIAEYVVNAPRPHVPVVPVRMTEAWLLIDEAAIRSAAGNPNGTMQLNLPDILRIETLPDPKRVLHDALTEASGLNARRRARLPIHRRVHRIPDYISDYTRLNSLPAFQSLQRDIRALLDRR